MAEVSGASIGSVRCETFARPPRSSPDARHDALAPSNGSGGNMSASRWNGGVAGLLALAGLLVAGERASAATSAVPAAPGRYVLTLDHAGLERSYLLAIPRSWSRARPAPLVLAFHGGGQTAQSFAQKRPDLFAKCEAEGFVLCFPQATGVGGRTHWVPVDGVLGLPPVDDPGFARALVVTLQAALALDPARTYACGFSSGGNFTHHLAATAPDIFAAVAPVAAGIGNDRDFDGDIDYVPAPLAPMPILMINGRRDTSRPYDGSPTKSSVAEAVDFWVAANLCRTTPLVRLTAIKRIDWYAPAVPAGAETVQVSLDRMTHDWPDRDDGFGFDANVAIIEFFKRHHR